jgi:hypothetical protein
LNRFRPERKDAMIRSILAAVLVVLAFAFAARAETAAGEGEDGRFIFKHVEDGFLRLDTRTGQVAFCSRHSVGFACAAAPDERDALEAEIARLRSENAALKKVVLTHGLDLPGGVKPDKPTAEGRGHDLNLPSDADLDRVMAFLERAWRRLVEMMTNLQHRS